MEEGRCNYERYRSLVQNKFHGVTESEALARIEVEMYPNTKNKDKGKQKLFRWCRGYITLLDDVMVTSLCLLDDVMVTSLCLLDGVMVTSLCLLDGIMVTSLFIR